MDAPGPETPPSAAPRPEGAGEARERRPLWRNPYVLVAIAGMIVIPLMRPMMRHVPPPPPTFGALPADSALDLIDDQGTRVTLASLRGQPTLMHAFYPGCGEVCAELDAAAVAVRDRLRAEAGLEVEVVALSLRPTEDAAPLQAARVAAGRQGDAAWAALGGSRDATGALARAVFIAPLGVTLSDAPEAARLSGFIALIDAEGQVRGHYDSAQSGQDELYHRARRTLHVADNTSDRPASPAP